MSEEKVINQVTKRNDQTIQDVEKQLSLSKCLLQTLQKRKEEEVMRLVINKFKGCNMHEHTVRAFDRISYESGCVALDMERQLFKVDTLLGECVRSQRKQLVKTLLAFIKECEFVKCRSAAFASFARRISSTPSSPTSMIEAMHIDSDHEHAHDVEGMKKGSGNKRIQDEHNDDDNVVDDDDDDDDEDDDDDNEDSDDSDDSADDVEEEHVQHQVVFKQRQLPKVGIQLYAELPSTTNERSLKVHINSRTHVLTASGTYYARNGKKQEWDVSFEVNNTVFETKKVTYQFDSDSNTFMISVPYISYKKELSWPQLQRQKRFKSQSYDNIYRPSPRFCKPRSQWSDMIMTNDMFNHFGPSFDRSVHWF